VQYRFEAVKTAISRSINCILQVSRIAEGGETDRAR